MDNRGNLEKLVSSSVMHLDGKDLLNDQCSAKKSLIEAIKAEKRLWAFIHSMGPSDTRVRELYHKACSSYETVILKDHEFAEHHDIELALWRLHYKHIEEFRNRIQVNVADKECTNSDVSIVPKNNNDNVLDLFRNFLSEATEFYQGLIVKIRESHGLPKTFSNLSKSGFSFGTESTIMRRCQFLCHRCLIYLGDLARYKELYGSPGSLAHNWSVAARYYLDASLLWPDSGNPQNQLAVLATYIGDELLAMYHCVRSLAIKEPFINAWDNLIFLFEKNRSSHLHAFAAKKANFNFLKPSEWMAHKKALSAGAHSEYPVPESTEGSDTKADPWCHFIQMISFFYTNPRLEEFPDIFAYALSEFEALLSLDDAKLEEALESYHQHMRIGDAARKTSFRSIQLVSMLIFNIHALSGSSELPTRPKYAEEMQQQPIFIQLSWAAAFIYMGRFVERYMMMTTDYVHSIPLLSSILVFVEWLACVPDVAILEKADEKCAGAMGYFFDVFVGLLNNFGDEFIDGEVESSYCIALWEDCELYGFSPLVPAHVPLDFSEKGNKRNGPEEREELGPCKHRIFAAAMKVANRLDGTGKWILFDKVKKTFCSSELKKPDTRESKTNNQRVGMDPMPERHSAQEEDDEIIVYQCNTKVIPAPTSWVAFDLSAHASIAARYSSDASSFDSSINEGFQFKVSHSEDSLRYPFFESSSSVPFCFAEQVTDQWGFVEVSDSDTVGYPSLSTWSLESEKSITAGEMVIIDPVKYGSISSIDEEFFSSADLTSLSINEISGSMQGSRPPYTTPIPSAPLLPDSEILCDGDSSAYAKYYEDYFQLGCIPLKSSIPLGPRDEKENPARYIGTTLNDSSYSNWISTGGFDSGFLEYNRYWGLRPRVDTLPSRGVYRYGEIASPDVRFRDPDGSKIPTYDIWTNPSVSHPINFSEGLFPPVGFPPSYGADEQKRREKLVGGYQRMYPCYGYGVSSDQISEQMLLVQYLKEKEWYLQMQRQLRGPT